MTDRRLRSSWITETDGTGTISATIEEDTADNGYVLHFLSWDLWFDDVQFSSF